MTVAIIDNNVGVGATTVGAAGTYKIQIPLASGQNTVYAQITNGCGAISTSASIDIICTAVAPVVNPTQMTSSNPILFTLPSVASLTPVSVSCLDTTPPAITTTPVTPPEQLCNATPSGPNDPTIVYPTDNVGLPVDEVWVSGIGDPGTVVLIFLNNEIAAQLIVSAQGTFGTMLHIDPGMNTIWAQTTKNGRTVVSKSIKVNYTNGMIAIVKRDPYTVAAQASGTIATASLAGVGIRLAFQHHWRFPKWHRKR
jgi:hypothetical protein